MSTPNTQPPAAGEAALKWNYLPRRSNFEHKFQRAAFKDATGQTIFTITANFGEDVKDKANEVLRACNSHAALVEALTRLEEGVRLWMTKPVEPADMDAARAALALASK